MSNNETNEPFAVNDWAQYAHGEKLRKVQVTAVNGGEVIVRLLGNPVTFNACADGQYVRAGLLGNEGESETITRIPQEPKKSGKQKFKDVRDFLHGMFWAP